MPEKDRRFLDENFPRFGTAWEGGLAGLARDFDLQAERKWRSIRLHLTLRSPPALRFTIEIKRKDGGMKTFGPELPEGPELTLTEFERVEELLRSEKELWLTEPPGGVVRVRDLSGGLAGLRGARTVQTRRLGSRAVVYLREAEGWGDHLCLWLDLRAGLEGVAWVDLPMDPGGRLLGRAEIDFIDTALRTHGDFGVYGNVQAGLRALASGMELRIREDAQAFHMAASPPDGHGHFLNFPIYKGSGEIGACAAGHLEPMILENPDPGDLTE